MALLNFRNTEPPDGYRYLQRETGVWIRAELLCELVDQVIAHRQYKNLGPTDKETVELEVQRQICAGVPKGICQEEPQETYRPFKDMARYLSLSKVEAA